MNRKLTLNELIVLGLIAERPRHGYDLEQTVRERGIREWTSLGLSSLYYLLEKLSNEGLIVPLKEKHESTDNRKVFAITDKGQEVCRSSLGPALTHLEPYGSSFLVGLSNSPLLSADELLQALKERERLITERLNAITQTRDSQHDLPDFVELIFDYSISLLKAEKIWLKKTAGKVDKMEKIDFKKELKHLYAPTSKEFTVVNVPKMKFLMVDGEGNPNTSEAYTHAVEALYSLSYTLKFASKNKLGKDYTVMPLEGLWTADDLSAFTTARNKDAWKWTMMIMQPDWITDEMFNEAVKAVREKKKPASLDKVRFESFDEGLAVQIMHIGSYDDEAPTLHRLHTEYMPQNNLAFNGHHHEIYIGDPRKTDPSKLKTVLRQPVKKK